MLLSCIIGDILGLFDVVWVIGSFSSSFFAVPGSQSSCLGSSV